MSLRIEKIKALLFDLDGTLADTDDDYIRTASRWVKPFNALFSKRDPTPFLRWAVMTIESPVNTLMALPDWLGIDDELVAVMNWFTSLRGNPPPGQYALMADVDKMLERLAPRYPLALITARDERRTRFMLDQLGLAPFFRVVVSAQTAPHTKPYPDPVHWAARAFNLPAENCLMIGDTTVDIRAGKRAGAQTVAVLCGFGQRDELTRAGADLILNHTAELETALA
jgi:HAD superfamily hydrolase (TIGR01509 family)